MKRPLECATDDTRTIIVVPLFEMRKCAGSLCGEAQEYTTIYRKHVPRTLFHLVKLLPTI